MKLLISLIFISVFTFISHAVGAHDPGLSFVEIKLQPDKLTANFSLAMRDIEYLVTVDTDHNGIVSVQEFTAAKPALRALASKFLSIYDQDQSPDDSNDNKENQWLPGKLQSIIINESDALQFTLQYPQTKANKLVVRSAIISELPRGHRQYLLIKDPADRLLINAMLSAASPEQMIKTPLFPQEEGSSSYLQLIAEFIKQGVWHIWIGFDHILFIVTLLLPVVLVYKGRSSQKAAWKASDDLRSILIGTLRIVTIFTLAHSITLLLAVMEVVQLPSQFVESTIALSVILVACNNLRPFFSHSRGLLVFLFGLIHGFGFANVLTELQLPENSLSLVLLGFNLGVEIGQVVIVILLLPGLYWLRRTTFYQPIILQTGSLAAVFIASFWLYERVAVSLVIN